jgi:hypothetical protein
MHISLTLNEADLTAAVSDWLDHRGYVTKAVNYSVTKGDRPGEGQTVTATVSADRQKPDSITHHP